MFIILINIFSQQCGADQFTPQLQSVLKGDPCIFTLKVPFINKSSEILKKKIKHIIRNTYYAANPRIVFTTKPLLTPGGKDPVSNFNKSMIIYQYSCCCTATSLLFLTVWQLCFSLVLNKAFYIL